MADPYRSPTADPDLVDTIRNDLRYALRQLRRQPGFTFIAVATLAIGIGAATAVFNAAEVALYRPLPMEHQDRLVRIYRIPEAGTPWISLRPATFAVVQREVVEWDGAVLWA